jgi:hypothetical protein
MLLHWCVLMKAGDIHTKPRDSFSAIPHDPPLRRNDGLGLFDLSASLFFHGLAHAFCHPSFSLFCHHDARRDLAGCNGLASTFQFFANLWKASAPLLRMTCPMSRTVECAPMYNGFSKIEIPSLPFRTIHRCEGMTDWGLLLCRPHSFSMASSTLFVTIFSLFCHHDARRDLAGCNGLASTFQLYF